MIIYYLFGIICYIMQIAGPQHSQQQAHLNVHISCNHNRKKFHIFQAGPPTQYALCGLLLVEEKY